jgi:CBS domain-containing protein
LTRRDRLRIARISATASPVPLRLQRLIAFSLIGWALSILLATTNRPGVVVLCAAAISLGGWAASAAVRRRARIEEALAALAVRDAMASSVDCVPAAISVAEAVRDHFLRSGYRGYPVLRGGTVIGFLHLSDVSLLSAEAANTTSVQGAMRPLSEDVVTGPEAPLLPAVAKMARARTTRLLVMIEDRLVGVFTLGGAIRCLARRISRLGRDTGGGR